MDKYEYNLKLEEIDKLVAQKNYQEAARLADTVDWRRVRNIRTICLISEIYEASDRLMDSKNLLERAYRRSPMGRTILYRLVEVTIKLQQYDEAMEYYTEYVQAAPHDNNKYILKYRICRGRGDSTEELIAVLEEYLAQEYTEQWGYELAKLYQKAGQMQKCLATCDDLVLWFHSGKYVMKALELKKRYAPLSPKQEEIYEEQCAQIREEQEKREQELKEQERKLLEQKQREQKAAEEEKLLEQEVVAVSQPEEKLSDAIMADTIMAETEKAIGDAVSAHKAELEQEQDDALPKQPVSELQKPETREKAETKEKPETKERPEIKENHGEKSDREEAAEDKQELQAASGKEDSVKNLEDLSEKFDDKTLQMELAKSMREIISGIVKRSEEEEEVPEQKEPTLHEIPRIELQKKPEADAPKLTIDDILLSMGEKGRKLAKAASGENETVQEGITEEAAEAEPKKRTVRQAAEEELTEQQREALRYTGNPEKLLRNRRSLPTYREEKVTNPTEEAIVNQTMKEEMQDILTQKTRTMPTEKIARLHAAFGQKEIEEEYRKYQETESGANGKEAVMEEFKNQPLTEQEEIDTAELEMEPVCEEEPETKPQEIVQEAAQQEGSQAQPAEVSEMEKPEVTVQTQPETEPEQKEELHQKAEPEQKEELQQKAEPEQKEELQQKAEPEQTQQEPSVRIPQHVRGLFAGFTEIPGLESQIAEAVMQASVRREDRTSRNGNILIFGPHGSGKTTLALNLAKAAAQDKGGGVLKLARIYAADLNRRDIAATIAKIAGGTLIVEEAGDLDDGTVEQLTTAMEFRTDGLLVILEDEQQYIQELLLRHPRFTMKFTSQIYLPVYSVEELGIFAQVYAGEQDCFISEDGMQELQHKISKVVESGEAVSVSEVVDYVGRAIQKSNKLFRKMALGKKRYDENDYVLLFAKDFR